jgi:hypothetical protein
VLVLAFYGRTWNVDVAGKPFDADVLMRRFRRAAEILEGADTGGQARNL